MRSEITARVPSWKVLKALVRSLDVFRSVINFKALEGFHQERDLTDPSHCIMAGAEPEHQKRGYFRSQGAVMMTQTRGKQWGWKESDLKYIVRVDIFKYLLMD